MAVCSLILELQWNLSIADTIGESQFVHYREVSLVERFDIFQHLMTRITIIFQGYPLREVPLHEQTCYIATHYQSPALGPSGKNDTSKSALIEHWT